VEEATVAAAAEQPKAEKPVAKSKPAKPAPKKAVKPAEKKPTGARARSMSTVPAAERRQAFLKLLRKMGADKATSAVPISKIAAKLGYNNYDVYCLGYHKFALGAGGYVKSAKLEDVKELSFYLTAKGVKSGPDDVEKKKD